MRTAVSTSAEARPIKRTAHAPRLHRAPSVSTKAVPTRPVEVDLGDPATFETDFWQRNGTDVYIHLEELHQADPGERSCAKIRILSSGNFTVLNAEAGTHCLGTLSASGLMRFAKVIRDFGDGCHRAELLEGFPQIKPLRPSGAQLLYWGGVVPELRLVFGNHCLGVLKGKAILDIVSIAFFRLHGGLAE